MDQHHAEIRQLKKLIDGCSRAVIFTGAGISTESGIPDFRSPDGIWSKTTPIYYDEFVSSEAARREAWRRKFDIDRDIDHAEPNRGHRAVARLVREGVVSTVITQNIDGLHQLSGVADEFIVELHGNGTYAKCLTCATRYELEPIKKDFLDEGIIPECRFCGGLIKGATISFGQAMPEDEMRRAHDATLACDLFIAIGSSLVVYPAAGFPAIAKENGANLVILNREPTDLDDLADLVLNLEIGPTLGEAANVN